MIPLDTFVQSTILNILKGVEGAQGLTDAPGALVGPIDGNYKPQMIDVEFDVEVSTSEAAGTKSGVGVFVGGLGLGVQGKVDAKNSSVGRIRFKVPVALPVDPRELAIVTKHRKKRDELALKDRVGPTAL